MKSWHNLKTDEVLQRLETSPSGLSVKEAKHRLIEDGLNKLPEPKGEGWIKIFLRQFTNFLTILLIIAFIISITSQPIANSIVLLVVILVNILLGFYLEFKAERALQSLAKAFVHTAEVRRDGKEKIIPTSQIVRGDIVILNQGDLVPADLRLISLKEISVNESALTGESVPSHKTTKPIIDAKVVSDQENMVFAGTTVASGSAEGVVVSVGEETELGKIAETLGTPTRKTPLQKRLDYLGKILALASIAAVFLVFVIGIMQGEGWLFLFNYSIALLVSVVPESLPTVVTLALAMGVLKMAKNRAVLRRLPSVETLATVNVICSDKTGTLSKNEMTAKIVWMPETQEIEIPGKGYDPEPVFDLEKNILEKSKNDKNNSGKSQSFIKNFIYCNNAKLVFEEKKREWNILGDPTEGALKVLAKKSGMQDEISEGERILEIPFTEKRKRMSVVVNEKDDYFVYAKGAPEVITPLCLNLSDEDKEKILVKAESLASKGYRILAFAYKEASEEVIEIKDSEKIESGLTFLGMVAFIDPPAEKVVEAIKDCALAKIKVIVISGDHKLTTLYFAKRLELKDDVGNLIGEKNVMVGEELDKISDEELSDVIDNIYVFARTTPMQKKKILRILKSQGNIVAMTGDGINDAPALKKSDVAIAMGKRGQEVAKEVSDIVLLDDNFATIRIAIEYARSIYDNVRKFLTFLLSGNFDELLLVLFAFVFGLPLPFTALQILWINLVTDSFPALALAFEEPGKDIMKEAPRDPKKSMILDVVLKAFFIGSLAFLFGLGLFIYYLKMGDSNKARTIVFTFSVFFELFVVFSIRSKHPFWQKAGNGLFSNKFLIIAVLLSTILQLAVLYTPLSIPLETIPLSQLDWIFILVPCLVSFLILEIIKAINLHRKNNL